MQSEFRVRELPASVFGDVVVEEIADVFEGDEKKESQEQEDEGRENPVEKLTAHGFAADGLNDTEYHMPPIHHGQRKDVQDS